MTLVQHLFSCITTHTEVLLRSYDDQPLDIETQIRRIQACIQAGIVGDKFVPGAIASGSYTGP